MKNCLHKFKIFKNGFTLAEVLITLVVIGVVAAMTIPTVITKYQKEQTVNQLKQAYSQLNQAARLSVPEYGDMNTWDYSLSSDVFLNKYFKFVKAKEMTIDRNDILNLRSDGQNETGLRLSYDGAKVIVLNSGAIIYASTYVPEGATAQKQRCYSVDLNGLKAPNKYGRDIFYFCLDGDRGNVIPHQWDDGQEATVEKTREQLKNGPSYNAYQCNKSNGRGMWCAALIIKDGWQIKDDYPW